MLLLNFLVNIHKKLHLTDHFNLYYRSMMAKWQPANRIRGPAHTNIKNVNKEQHEQQEKLNIIKNRSRKEIL